MCAWLIEKIDYLIGKSVVFVLVSQLLITWINIRSLQLEENSNIIFPLKVENQARQETDIITSNYSWLSNVSIEPSVCNLEKKLYFQKDALLGNIQIMPLW